MAVIVGLPGVATRPRSVIRRVIPDAEWLARLVLLLAPRQGPGPEWAGIMHAAINRAKAGGASVEQTVCSPLWYGGGRPGSLFVIVLRSPRGVGFKDALGRCCPGEHPRFDQALGFALDVLEGKVKNPIGHRRYFCYPGAAPRCDCEGEWTEDGARCCVNGRWLARRFVDNERAIRVGRALFC